MADTKTDTNEEWQSFVERRAKLGLNGSHLAC